MNIVRAVKDSLLQGYQVLANAVAALAMEHPSLSAKFIPAARKSLFYIVPKAVSPKSVPAALPVPPREIWENVYDSTEEYLATGREHVGNLRELLKQHQAELQPGQRALEMGCATGRLLRWFKDEAERGEFWGIDLNAAYIAWCQQHLSPPFHFAATTTFPHLPFSDGYFDLIYAGSVFSHISELVDAWFLELRRILKTGGKLYVTVHDNHTIKLLETTRRHEPLAQMLVAHRAKLNAAGTPFGMFTMRRSPRGAQVFYDREYLFQKLEPLFDVLAVRPEAYGHQTGILLARK